ncbi:hypothetical protein ACLOAV_007965 [Pseudogymnoascus australis]
MVKPGKDFTATFNALVTSLGLKDQEEAYNKCRARFFMDTMKLVNDKVASGDPTAKSLEAEYATLVETRGSQNSIPTKEKTNNDDQSQTTEDLELKFQVLAKAVGTLPGEPGYKRLLRTFLTAEYSTNAQKYCCKAKNLKGKKKTFKFEALALVCGLEYDSPRYNKFYNDFFQKTGVLLASALESTNGHEGPSSTKIMTQGTNNSSTAAGSSQKPDDESDVMKSLRDKLAAARLNAAESESVPKMPAPEARFHELVLSLGVNMGSKRYKQHRRQFFKYEHSRDDILKSGDDIAIGKLERFEEICATRGLQQGTKEFRIFKSHFDIENEDDSETSSDSSFSLCGLTSADDDSRYALQFKGRLQTINGNNLNGGGPSDRVATHSQRSNTKQPKRGHNRARNDGAQRGGAQKDGSQKDNGKKGGAKNEGPQKGGFPKERAQKAKEDFDAYFGNPRKLENWQRLCRDLDINPVPTSITQCKKETKKIYVNIYQFLHQTKTGFRATRFSSQAELAEYCNRGPKRKFPRNIAKRTGALAGLLHYVN